VRVAQPSAAACHLTQLQPKKTENIGGMRHAKPDPNERAKRYHARAEECLRLIERGTLPDVEAQYLRHLAECYSELALVEEKRAAQHAA